VILKYSRPKKPRYYSKMMTMKMDSESEHSSRYTMMKGRISYTSIDSAPICWNYELLCEDIGFLYYLLDLNH
jgi:hypothetical protein